MRLRLTGLWRNQDFVRLWAAQTVSIFGSLVTRTALPFVAILTLDATPFQIAFLGIAEMAPAFLIGLVAGAWVDRLPRRPIMIAADLGRAALVLTIPLGVLFDALRIELLYIVAALVSVLTTFFDVAYQSYLPTLVRKDQLIEGNSKLTASASASEFVAFGAGGWFVQLFRPAGALVIDAFTFLWSAWFLWRIKRPEPPPARAEERAPIRREIVDGVRRLIQDPTLRAVNAASMTLSLASRSMGTVYLLYVSQEVGFDPGVLGMMWAVGGIGAFAGALATSRVNAWLGIGPAMMAMLVVIGLGQSLIALATGVTLVAVVFLVAQQLISDPAWSAFEVNVVSLRQAVTPERLLGRVTASMRVLDFGAMTIGALIGGWLGETVGLRPTIVIASAAISAGALWLAFSPVRGMRETPAVRGDVVPEVIAEVP
ncbi:MAG: MFS transporter [Thermomicrobiales bacterium]